MIVIPMAGLSSRFFKAGFEKPKYMLEAHSLTLFEHAVNSFEKYFKTEHFVFIVRDVFDTPEFVKDQAEKLGIHSFEVSILNDETRGQAETVFVGTKHLALSSEPITIFNIDTFRPGFEFPKNLDSWDGYLEVFEGTGDNWSFAKPISSSSTQVIETAEKRPISNLCCTGLYQFKSLEAYRETYQAYVQLPESQWEKGELYVAPLYNYLIHRGDNIHYHVIDRTDVIFCGVPDEYYDFLDHQPVAR